MADLGPYAATVEGRYALALYELAWQHNALDSVGRDLSTLQKTLAGCEDFRRLVHSPLIQQIDQAHALNAIADKIGAAALTKKFLGVLIRNRRLSLLGEMIAAVFAIQHERQGEVTADVYTPAPLTDLQAKMLVDNLQAVLKRHVTLNVTEDKTLLGGLVVKIGSRLFDGSIKNKLERMRRVLLDAA